MLWDTAGQEEFDCITRAYYRCGPHFSSFRITQFHITGQNIFPTEQYFLWKCWIQGRPGLRACLLLCGQGVVQTGGGSPISHWLIRLKVTRWKRKVEEECGNIPMVLVMTKMDLFYKADIDASEAEKLSRILAIKLLRTSVKENLNVSTVFEFLASQHLSELSQWMVDPPIIQV